MADAFKGLVDRYGRPIEKAALKVEQAGPVVGGIRRTNAMHPAAGLTPGRLAAILRGSIDGDPEQYLALAEDMEERDNHYAGVLGVRKRQVSGLDVTVVAAGEDKVSVAAADLVREIVDRDGFADELFDMFDAIGKGFSLTEIIWDTSEGQWRPKRLAWRDPRWFTFDPSDGETPLLKKDGSNVPLNPYQWIFHAAKVKSGLPIRGGLARAVAWTFLFKSFTIKDWAIFCEAYGQPLRLGKWSEGASEADKAKLLEAVTNIGTDYSAIIPLSMAVEFIKADLSGSHDLYEKRSDWLDRQVSKVVLGQTATTDAIAGGHAVGKTHDNVRDDIEIADARQGAGTLNRDLVKPAVDLNFGPQKKYPRVLIGRADEVDVTAFIGNVKTFVSMGGKVSAAFVGDKIGVPEPGKEEELLTAPREAAPSNLNAPPAAIDQEEAVNSSETQKKRDGIERATNDLLGDWEPLVKPIVAGLQAEIAAASSVDDVKAILARQFKGLNVDALTEQLARSAFAARLAGETNETL
jgi:phage gp29-like protein